MALLLADPQIHNYDIIAIQEPWTNPFQDTTYCLSLAPFLLVYLLEKGRCCFLINKKLNITTWEPFFLSLDLCILKLETKGQRI